jgi:lipid-A-disaccharide synthase
MRRTVDRVAVVLPFEAAIYRDAGMEAEFVGHPFVTDHELPAPLPVAERDGIALLPGSRTSEVDAMLPVFLDAASELLARRPGLRIAVGRSPVVSAEVYDEHVRDANLQVEMGDGAVGVLSRARAAMVASGTATLEAALLETPLLVAYRTGSMNYALAKRLVKIPNVGLVNVLHGEEVAPEFVQGDATPEALADAIERMLADDAYRDAMVARFRGLRAQLTQGAGSERVAEMAGELLR